MTQNRSVGKPQLADFSRRVLVREAPTSSEAEFILNDVHWIYSENIILRRISMFVSRLEASKLAQCLRFDTFKLSYRLEKLISILEIKIRVFREEDLRPSNKARITVNYLQEHRTLYSSGADGPAGLLATHLEVGQGLGNQLWAYAALRTAAFRTKLDFAVTGENNYKGNSFLDIDFGHLIDIPGSAALENFSTVREQVLRTQSGTDISQVDANVLRPEPNSLLIGNFQSYNYLLGYEREIRSAVRLRDDAINLGEDVTVLHVRMGDFMKNDVWLGPDYYFKAMSWIRERNPRAKFLIVSDQPRRAAKLLKLRGHDLSKRPFLSEKKPSPPIAPHHHGKDLRGDFNVMYSAKSIVLPASSLSWWAAFLSLDEKQIVIAPERWAAHNLGGSHWSTAEIATPGFSYLSRDGKIKSYG